MQLLYRDKGGGLIIENTYLTSSNRVLLYFGGQGQEALKHVEDERGMKRTTQVSTCVTSTRRGAMPSACVGGGRATVIHNAAKASVPLGHWMLGPPPKTRKERGTGADVPPDFFFFLNWPTTID